MCQNESRLSFLVNFGHALFFLYKKIKTLDLFGGLIQIYFTSSRFLIFYCIYLLQGLLGTGYAKYTRLENEVESPTQGKFIEDTQQAQQVAKGLAIRKYFNLFNNELFFIILTILK